MREDFQATSMIGDQENGCERIPSPGGARGASFFLRRATMNEDYAFYWKLLDTIKDGVYFVNRERKITYWNKAAEEMTGYKNGEVLGRFCGDNFLIHIDEKGNNLCNGACPLAKVLETGMPGEDTIFLHHKRGHRVPITVRVTPVKHDDGTIIGAVEIFSDRSVKEMYRKRIQDLENLGHLDPITEFPNQRYMEMILKIQLMELQQYNWPFGILYVRISQGNKRKASGEQNSDEKSLRIIAQTLINTISPFDIMGCWTEGEFLGIFRNADAQRIEQIESLYLMLMNKSDLPSENKVRIKTASFLPRPDDSVESVLDKARKRAR